MKTHFYQILPKQSIHFFLTLITAESLYLLGCTLLYRHNPPAAAALLHIPQFPIIYEHLLMSLTLTIAGTILFTIAEQKR